MSHGLESLDVSSRRETAMTCMGIACAKRTRTGGVPYSRSFQVWRIDWPPPAGELPSSRSWTAERPPALQPKTLSAFGRAIRISKRLSEMGGNADLQYGSIDVQAAKRLRLAHPARRATNASWRNPPTTRTVQVPGASARWLRVNTPLDAGRRRSSCIVRRQRNDLSW